MASRHGHNRRRTPPLLPNAREGILAAAAAISCERRATGLAKNETGLNPTCFNLFFCLNMEVGAARIHSGNVNQTALASGAIFGREKNFMIQWRVSFLLYCSSYFLLFLFFSSFLYLLVHFHPSARLSDSARRHLGCPLPPRVFYNIGRINAYRSTCICSLPCLNNLDQFDGHQMQVHIVFYQ